jgi:hypothetical protein
MKDNDGMKDMEAFALALLNSATCAHIQHWQTRNYATHKALKKYYEAIPDLVDKLVETYMGRNGLVGDFEEEFEIEKEPVRYFKALQKYVDESRKHLPKDSELQNIIDEIFDLINSTLYKLQNLS